MSVRLTPEQLSAELAIRDLTDPAEGAHAVQQVVDRVVHALAARWGCAVRWCRGDRIVTVEDNYDNLGYAAEAVTREARYTRYVSDGRVLRSHATAMVPPALRALAADPVADVLLVCPGIVYRRDAIDRHHTGTPHQLDLWRVVRRPLSGADLRGMIAVVLDSVLPGVDVRLEPRVHPYTRGGHQVDVASGGSWIEVGEGGLAHRDVLVGAGLGRSWSGLALGLGLDRLLMLVKSIPDIRLLRSARPEVAAQMVDLSVYRPVSTMPAIRRDISIAVAADDLVEDLGDRVRDALGDGAGNVESVTVLDETPCALLSDQARARLGAEVGQKNVLARIVLRSHDRTLSTADANRLRDRIYAALHRGVLDS
jgi:phenylalanyl-tRNA synthetase alpha chain